MKIISLPLFNIKRMALVVAVIGLLLSSTIMPVQKVQAASTSDLLAQIEQLMQIVLSLQAQVAAINGSGNDLNPEGGFDNRTLSVGESVQTTDVLKIRTGAGTNYQWVNSVPAYSEGKVLSGPKYANGYTWWFIQYENAAQGWSVENWLKRTDNYVELPSKEELDIPSCVIKSSNYIPSAGESFIISWETTNISNPAFNEGLKAGGDYRVPKSGSRMFNSPTGYAATFGISEELDKYAPICSLSLKIEGKNKTEENNNNVSDEVSVSIRTNKTKFDSRKDTMSIDYEILNAPTGATFEIQLSGATGNYRMIRVLNRHKINSDTPRSISLSSVWGNNKVLPSKGTISYPLSYENGSLYYDKYLPIEGKMLLILNDKNGNLIATAVTGVLSIFEKESGLSGDDSLIQIIKAIIAQMNVTSGEMSPSILELADQANNLLSQLERPRSDLQRKVNSAALKGKINSPEVTLGTYKGYINGSRFILTENISKADAYTNCKLNAGSNSSSKVYCTWEDSIIYDNRVVMGSMALAVGAYQGTYKNDSGNYGQGSQGEVDVYIADGSFPKGSMTLVLTSYEPVKWNISGPGKYMIGNVFASGYYDQEVSGLSSSIKVDMKSYESGDSNYFYAFDSRSTNYSKLQEYIQNNYNTKIQRFLGSYTQQSVKIDGYKG